MIYSIFQWYAGTISILDKGCNMLALVGWGSWSWAVTASWATGQNTSNCIKQLRQLTPHCTVLGGLHGTWLGQLSVSLLQDHLILYAEKLKYEIKWFSTENVKICIKGTFKGYYTPNQKYACFVLHLKIINTFSKNNTCILYSKLTKKLELNFKLVLAKTGTTHRQLAWDRIWLKKKKKKN